jgi:chemotaxis family two-component system response regulator Rcp1
VTTEILLVDDNEGDAELIREAMRELDLDKNLTHVSDGLAAMELLRGIGRFSGMKRPRLILLDLNLPGMDGREILADIKADPKLCTIPVVVLTTSTAESDIVRSYQLHANCYVAKPLDMTQFTEVVSTIERFWLSVARLPQAD